MTADQFDPASYWYWNEGTERRAQRVLGARPGPDGTTFAVWAPNASSVSVVGDHDDWNEAANPMEPVGGSGVWAAHVAGVGAGDRYKFRVRTPDGEVLDKADPFARRAEVPPATASVVDDGTHEFRDAEWMTRRAQLGVAGAGTPCSVYEVHLGSWGRTLAAEGRFPDYRELGASLGQHAAAHGFTHVELMPVMEHPFYGSWGYQVTGFFAPTSRYGSPSDLMAMVDALHGEGIGVIFDWVPSHFPTDRHGLARFDGTHLFEHADPRQGHHPDWDSAIFNYGRNEVRSFLISSALHWIEQFHADGLRVDAVASMLYLDYSRQAGEWIPNRYGGRENLEAIDFLRQLNDAVAAEAPGVAVIAEESTAFPGVTAPTHEGGLGFSSKWDMGWMHDTLSYLRRDPAHRRWHHDELTFRAVYAFSERYTLPLSHDEVVHGKGSLLDQMPGDRWQQLANLRLLYGDQWTQPGAKLLFMGGELAPERDWSHEATLDWSLHDRPGHEGVRRWITALNELYRSRPALHAADHDPITFEWIIGDDDQNSIVAYLRRAGTEAGSDQVLVVLNATPTPHAGYRIGVPVGGDWQVLLDGDATEFGGSGYRDAHGADTVVATRSGEAHGHQDLLELTIGPLSTLVLGAPTAPG
ncbi:MAG: 1,4-alpha-glucan branching protein GlgB [Actinomycetota bacterium]|nr:1,4-alpha-glucan branching protein GlgB [Actinomycetota bacterium]